MSDYDYLPASNGSGDAVLMHIEAPGRLVGATVIPVDSVVNVPTKFIATAGTPLASGFIDPATAINFKGHTSGSTLVIDAFEPGSSDAPNTAGQIVVIKPNTGWANRVAAFIKNTTNFGTPENIYAAAISAASMATTANATVGGNLTVTGSITANGALSGITSAKIPSYSAFRAYQTASFVIPSSLSILKFDTKDFDVGNDYSTTTGLFTARVTGTYHFDAYIRTSQGSGSHRVFTYAIKNGSTPVGIGTDGYGTFFNGSQWSDTIRLAATDTLQIQMQADVALNGDTSFAQFNRFSGYLVSAP